MRRLLLLLLLAGCAGRPPPLPADTAFIAQDVALRVPAPSLLRQTVNVAQTVQADYAGQAMVFEAQIAITPTGLDMVVLDGLGRRAMTIAWHGEQPVADTAPWLPRTISAANMLADIALIYWPEALLQPALAAAGARLETVPGRRSVFAGGQEILRMESAQPGWGGRASLRNLAFGYRLDVQSVLLAP